MEVKDIVKKYLEDSGFDGLVHGFDDCGCYNDDLMPCRLEISDDCEPAYKIACPCDPEEGCEFGDWPGHFHMTTEKPTDIIENGEEQ